MPLSTCYPATLHRGAFRTAHPPGGASLWLSWLGIPPPRDRSGFDAGVGKIPWRKEQLPTPVFWPGEFHGLYSPWGRKQSDTTKRLSLWSQTQKKTLHQVNFIHQSLGPSLLAPAQAPPLPAPLSLRPRPTSRANTERVPSLHRT